MKSPVSIPALPKTGSSALVMGAIGVVYGDIGTSPLYTMKEVFGGTHPVVLNHENVLGILSVIFLSLLIVVSLKYVMFVMRADNRGEGGIMALMALTQRVSVAGTRNRWIMMVLGIFGAALFYGDGMITPAISVLSAVEGLEVATPLLKPYVIPVTLGVLIGLFTIQRKGTGGIGALFGPAMCIWFGVLAVLGLVNILKEPAVLQALNPYYAISFFAMHKWHGFLALGAVVLALTGAEALYADMGHFGRPPIAKAWFWFVLPALLLNYFGQGALLLHDPTAVRNPFYLMVPVWGLFALVMLATVATIIASQAVISGAFSLTRQAIQLGYCPRMEILHTSDMEIGQIYVPAINWSLLVAIIALVLGFQSSSNLAAAYGVAVTGTMAITTVLAFVVVRKLWKWNRFASGAVVMGFLSVDLAFLGANVVKIEHGGWFPLVIGAAIFTLMSTWKRGREIVFDRLHSNAIALEPFLEGIAKYPPIRVPGTAVFMTAHADGVPHALLHNLNHNKVLHDRVALLTVVTEDVPYVGDGRRLTVQPLGNNFFRITIRYGFKDDPDIPKALMQCTGHGVECNLMETSFFLSRETLIPSIAPGMALWRERLFASMARNAGAAMSFFKIPTNRVVELGTQIEL